MNLPKRMLVANVAWAQEMGRREPNLFRALAMGQKPQVLWIGCSDSRVPAETITHCAPGDLFVHRNIANLLHLDDDNTMSVLEYAVCELRVAHIIVCGHYGCGGVRASLLPPADTLPHFNRRIRPLCALAHTHHAALARLPSEEARINRLVELNVLEQVRLLREHPLVRERAPSPLVHGWIFSLNDGQLRELESGFEPETTKAIAPV
ncbi:carbonic anhydrase [Paraburkholderia atlantica]|uniref:Carbonic anhydrase n=2 Tax=Paraburkholderia TaxID=1822464 RepID=A0A7W8LE78_9BURK|nr:MULTISPECIES: carbonic anhydrase [Paraburkholderia]MBB5405351.1 carbonic anhydrase [Paraburkholderia youngii]MBB5421093.1 carbonic anhydrase [Paraburkholderia atlantica]MBB5429822.1 carbonic anhydrase [Paraburkholderia atlantica]MPW11674.1 carbonic anhydrase [Paraburkholderia atlantica]